MSPSFSEGFEAQNVQGCTPAGSTRVTVGGRRFSDVTNSGLSFYSSPIKNLDNLHRENFDKTQHLQQEIASLKKQLTEKEAILQYTRHEMHKVLQYKTKVSQQNLQLAQTNGQMFAELCMIRGKLKLLQHDYNQMSAMFKVKTTELEQKVSALSMQLQEKNQIGAKEPNKSENTLEAPPKCLLLTENQICASQRLGRDLKGGEKSSRIKLSADEDINVKRHLASSRESKLATKCRREGKTVTPMLNQIDQSDVSFTAGDLSNEVSSSRENGSINEEASDVNRVSTGRGLASSRESKLATKRRQEGKTVSTPMLNQIDQSDLPNEENGSIKEEASDVNRVSTGRGLASTRESKLATKHRQEGKTVSTPMLNQIDQSDLPNEVNSSYEEASNVNRVSTGRRLVGSGELLKLATKCRQEGKTVSTPMLNQIDQSNASFSAPETFEEVCAGDLPNEVNSSSRANGSINEEASNVNRVCSGRWLAGSGETKLATKYREEVKAIFTPMLNQIDQSKASFSAPETLEDVCAGDLPNEVNSSSRVNGSTNEEASNVNRASLGRPCTDLQDKEPPLHAIPRQEGKAVFTSTLNQTEQIGDSISGLETILQEVCADNICAEANSSSTTNSSANEEASNEKRTSLRRRSANVCYKEPSLNKKLRQQSVPLNDLEILEVYKGDISNEVDNSSKINVTSNRENKKVKRVCLRRHSANVTYRDSNLNRNKKQEGQTVLTPRFCESDQFRASFSGFETLEKVSEDEELHVQKKTVINGDMNENFEGRQCCVFPTTEGKSCKVTKVKHRQKVQGIAPCQGSSLDAASEPTEMSRRSLAGRPVRKAVEGIASYKEVPRNIKMRRSE